VNRDFAVDLISRDDLLGPEPFYGNAADAAVALWDFDVHARSVWQMNEAKPIQDAAIGV
jgi:hypothetical protein